MQKTRNLTIIFGVRKSQYSAMVKKKKKKGTPGTPSVSAVTETTFFLFLVNKTSPRAGRGGVGGKDALGVAEVYSGCNGIKFQLTF